jgi:hypothetical protein
MDLSWATEPVTTLLGLKDSGQHRMELVSPRLVTPPEAAQALRAAAPALWFPEARSPQGAVAALWLYFGAFEEAHALVQDLETAEGSYWHAIVHRTEPDSSNSGYWFRRVGHHGIFPALRDEAARIVAAVPGCGFDPGPSWNPDRFTAFCEAARGQPGSGAETAAQEIQFAEWLLLFAWCGMRR